MLLAAWLLSACSQMNDVEKVQQERVLHVITRATPVSYYVEQDVAEGFEYELAEKFSQDLGVSLRVRVAESLDELIEVTTQGYTSLALVGMDAPVTDTERADLNYSRPFLNFSSVVIYRKGKSRPETVEELPGRHLVVPESSPAVAYLASLREGQLTELEWQAIEDAETPELLALVDRGEVDLAIVSSIEFAMYNRLFPKLRKAFDLIPDQSVSWVFPGGPDTSLLEAANAFLERAEADGTLPYLRERYFGHVEDFDYVGARTFIRHLGDRLPKYREVFEEAGAKHNIDWRLLAAIGYQESHWRPYARSPTGVRGLMMLTLDTAREVGVKNRLDPVQSIRGGAEYFARVRARLPDEIQEPHRSWMALAAYNVGYGHLMDARRITDGEGLDPNIWQNVKKHLPLLQKREWYSQTRYGYARGWEPVHYVQNIRRYYDVLVQKMPPLQTASTDELTDTQDTQDANLPLSPDLPEVLRVTPPTL